MPIKFGNQIQILQTPKDLLLASRDRKLEIGNWKLEIGNWKLADTHRFAWFGQEKIGSGALSISNSTFHANTADFGGGGIAIFNAATLSIFNSTLSGNSAGDSGGGIFISNNSSGTLTISNSLVVGNTAPADSEIRGTLTDNGGNLLSIPGSLTLNDVLLPLADNGGPTQTHALPPGSPAIDMGDNDNIPLDSQDADNDSNTSEAAPFDQRSSGFNRVVGESVDIGAFEVQSTQNTPPVITLSGDNPLDLECGSSFADVDPGATAMDAQQGNLSGSIVVDSSAVDANSLGTYTVTYNVMDSQGAAATEVARTVHVVDTTAPTLTIPADVTVESTSPDGQEVNFGTAMATDACDADPTISNNAPTLFVPGTTIVTWTATDDEGNASTANQMGYRRRQHCALLWAVERRSGYIHSRHTGRGHGTRGRSRL